MPSPVALQRPPAGIRYDPTTIDATGATLGDYLGAVSDGSGGQRTGFLPLPDSGGGGGISTGTPGNMSVPLYQGAPQVYAPMPSGITEPQQLKDNVRKLHNFLNVVKIRLQVVIKQAVTGGKIIFQVSDNGGSVWKYVDLAGGGYVATDATGYPVPGDWFDVDETLQVNNLMWRAVLYAPDGTTATLEHGVIWLDMVSADTPPATDIPSDPALPADGGTTWGAVILDLLANNITGIADLARAIPFPDASGGAHDGGAVPSGTGSVRSGGEYHVSGFGGSGGAYPFVRVKAGDYGWKVYSAGSFAGNATYYYLIDNVTGTGTADTATILFAGDEGTNSSNRIRIQSDGKLFIAAGDSIFGESSATGTIAVNDGNPHIIRVIHAAGGNVVYVYIDGVLDITLTGGGGGNLTYPWTLWTFMGNGNSETGQYDFHQAVWYNKNHANTAGINAVETAILGRAGL